MSFRHAMDDDSVTALSVQGDDYSEEEYDFNPDTEVHPQFITDPHLRSENFMLTEENTRLFRDNLRLSLLGYLFDDQEVTDVSDAVIYNESLANLMVVSLSSIDVMMMRISVWTASASPNSVSGHACMVLFITSLNYLAARGLTERIGEIAILKEDCVSLQKATYIRAKRCSKHDDEELNQYLNKYFMEKAVKHNSPLLVDANRPMFTAAMRAHGHKKKRCSRIREDKYLHMYSYYESVPNHFIQDGFQITEVDEPEPVAWHPWNSPEDDDDGADENNDDHIDPEDQHDNGEPNAGDNGHMDYHPDDYLSDDNAPANPHVVQNGVRDNSFYTNGCYAAPAAMAHPPNDISDTQSEGTFHSTPSQFDTQNFHHIMPGDYSDVEMPESFYHIPQIPPPIGFALLEDDDEEDTEASVESNMMKVCKCLSDTDISPSSVRTHDKLRHCRQSKVHQKKRTKKSKKYSPRSSAPTQGPWHMRVEKDFEFQSDSDVSSDTKKRGFAKLEVGEERPRKKKVSNDNSKTYSQLQGGSAQDGVKLTIVQHSSNALVVRVCEPSSLEWIGVLLYSLPSRSGRAAFWTQLNTSLSHFNYPMIILGDFNQEKLSHQLQSSLISLHNWSKASFGSLDKLVNKLTAQLSTLQIQWEDNPQDHQLTSLLEQKQVELDEALQHQNDYWQQQSKLIWPVQGARNTKFFHKWTTRRKGVKWINELRNTEGQWLQEPDQTTDLIQHHFKDIYNVHNSSSPNPILSLFQDQLLDAVQETLTPDQVSLIAQPFTAVELWAAVSQMSSWKAPGPYGIPVGFCKKYKTSIGPDVESTILEEINHQCFPLEWN
ncbi:OLC1v1029253C1 [Oldenlandia corymbosa var. corymbosa]|uniref:OLC1v1029253C1 n=1 Tax=Oldenlandia corymbosa var. corymbosa TaxID=529605 RepID=A0AAV1CDZ7_OLDCO|nr:OLC1v1029253C1 [Oldenlandia corymbosa var. corymbosa]